jgi:hypothetical protein
MLHLPVLSVSLCTVPESFYYEQTQPVLWHGITSVEVSWHGAFSICALAAPYEIVHLSQHVLIRPLIPTEHLRPRHGFILVLNS